MARFAGDKDIKFKTGLENFENVGAQTNKKGNMIDVNTSYIHGKVNITIQPDLQQIVNPKPVRQMEDINPVTPANYQKKPITEEKKSAASKPIMDDILLQTKSDVDLPYKSYEDYYSEFNYSTEDFKQSYDTWEELKNQSIEGQFKDSKTNLFSDSKNMSIDAKFMPDKKTEFSDKHVEHTNYGGGADFITTYKRDVSSDNYVIGNTKINLSKKNRTDTKGFHNKAALFLDKAVDFEEFLRSEEGDGEDKAAAKVAVLFEHSARKHNRTADRYNEIDKSLKKEIKDIKRDIELEKYEREVNSKFINEDSVFIDDTMEFTSELDEMFDKPSSGYNFIEEKSDAKKQTSLVAVRDKSMSVGGPDSLLISRNQLVATNDMFGIQGVSALEVSLPGVSLPGVSANTQGNQGNQLANKQRLELKKSQKKATKKSKNKEIKKAATRTAVANMLRNSKALRNDITGESSGNIMKDGQGALLVTLLSAVKTAMANLTRKILMKLWSMIVHALISFFMFIVSTIIPVLIQFIPVILIFVLILFLGQNSDEGETFDVNNITGNGQYYSTLDESDISTIMSSIRHENPLVTQEKLAAIEYALNKVGSEYNQAYHGNNDVDIFDCSSLVYRAYKEAGIDISNNGYYTAAEECRSLMEAGNTATDGLKAGDLIFYGGSDNGRYMGIYHVAIYVGKVNGVDKMVEARSTEAGVVFCDVRTNNVVNVSHPT